MERLLFSTVRERGNSVWQSPKGTAVQATKSHYSRALHSRRASLSKVKNFKNSWSCATQKTMKYETQIWKANHTARRGRMRGGWGGGRWFKQINTRKKKRERERNIAVIFLSTQQSWRCILWATDEQAGWRTPAGPESTARPSCWWWGGAFRVPFSITPRWATLKKTPKEKKTKNRTRLEHQVDPTARAIFWKCLWRL